MEEFPPLYLHPEKRWGKLQMNYSSTARPPWFNSEWFWLHGIYLCGWWMVGLHYAGHFTTRIRVHSSLHPNCFLLRNGLHHHLTNFLLGHIWIFEGPFWCEYFSRHRLDSTFLTHYDLVLPQNLPRGHHPLGYHYWDCPASFEVMHDGTGPS